MHVTGNVFGCGEKFVVDAEWAAKCNDQMDDVSYVLNVFLIS